MNYGSIPVRSKFFFSTNVQIGREARPGSNSVGAVGFSTGLKQPGRETDHLSLSKLQRVGIVPLLLYHMALWHIKG